MKIVMQPDRRLWQLLCSTRIRVTIYSTVYNLLAPHSNMSIRLQSIIKKAIQPEPK